MKLKPEYKQAWVEALRSGDYEQGKGALNRLDRFCCLGVLCDLAVKQGVGEWILDPLRSHKIYLSPAGDLDGLMLPRAVQELVQVGDGRRYPDPFIQIDSEDATRRVTLSVLNDQHDLTFSQLADLIEESL